ncbi:MAG TPA: D-alanine--D-alanine ligase [Flavobacterium sp.]|jgi:hypothetical protein
MKLFLHKLFHWEYWPFYIVYIPVYFQWAYYSLKARTLFFFNACNPSIKNGGFMSESKMEIYDLIPQQYFPKTILIKSGSCFEDALQQIHHSGIVFPMIAKPDIGLRGSAVRKLNTIEQLRNYQEKAAFDYLLQDLIPYQHEAGIFYVRYPHEKQGKITGIVGKEFLIIKGDGKSTIEALVKNNPRYAFQLTPLRREYGNRLAKIPAEGEEINLVPYGNHARGAKFTDESWRISEQLTHTINEVCLQVPGFFFGRLDVMYRTFEELEQGRNFQIVEINGASSEPTHIYDPRNSIFFAWKEIRRHIRYMYEISNENHKNGTPYLSHRQGMEQYRIHNRQSKKITRF